MRLRTAQDLFRRPDLDPFSDWYESYSERPAIEYVLACVGDDPRAEHVALVVQMPPETIDDGLEARLLAAVKKYCRAHLTTVSREAAQNNSRGWLMLAFTVIAVGLLLWLAQRWASSAVSVSAIAAQGLSIAAWVLLWHPLEALVFNRWDYRLDKRVLRTIHDRATLTVKEALPASPEVAAATALPL